MNENIFIPKTVTVGYVKRASTSTGRLAFITYRDTVGKLLKGSSWEKWKDDNIPSDDFENKPTDGFILNKNIEGYSTEWYSRQTYMRVCDPRGFEFEINLPNLLYILEHTSIAKGKRLEGEFIYGWNGTELILMPTCSPHYKGYNKESELMYEKRNLKGSDLILGATYIDKDCKELVYLGKYKTYKRSRHNYIPERLDVDKISNHYWFIEVKADGSYGKFHIIKSLSRTIVNIVNEQSPENLDELLEKAKKSSNYAPIDNNKDEYVPLERNEFIQLMKANSLPFGHIEFLSCDKEIHKFRVDLDSKGKYLYYNKGQTVVEREHKFLGFWNEKETFKPYYKTADDLYDEYKPHKLRKYLDDGRLFITISVHGK